VKLNLKRHHKALIALTMVPGMGPARARKLLKLTGIENAGKLFEMSVQETMKVDGIGKQVAYNLARFDKWPEVDRVLEKASKAGASLLATGDEHYPHLLKHIYDPPLILWYRGDPAALVTPGIAVIGTRSPSRYGLQQAENWTKKLVQSGLSINSGLAYGIDAIAHQTALNQGGVTVAVLGSGIDQIYPAKNKALASRIAESGGVVMSEFLPGTQPDAGNFPERNRIVSGMSHGVLVVESGVKGGSMITAKLAIDQNREVFVVPHHLGYLKGEGCNLLIKTGQGKLIQKADDVMEELSVDVQSTENSEKNLSGWKELHLTAEEKSLCELLDNRRLHIDQISELTGEPSYKLLPIMLELEMKGAITQKAGKYFELC
jgi:DNA processing protein